MRVAFAAVIPSPGPLSEGEGEKQYALFSGRISMSCPGRDIRRLANVGRRAAEQFSSKLTPPPWR